MQYPSPALVESTAIELYTIAATAAKDSPIYTQNIVQYTVPLGHEIAGSLQHPAIVQKLDRLTKIEIYPQDYVK